MAIVSNKDEFKLIQEYSKKDNRNYRVFRVEEVPLKERRYPEDKLRKVTMVRFHAKDDRDAFEYLKSYRRAANREYTYYFEHWNPHLEVINGKVTEFNSMIEGWKAKDRETPLLKRVWEEVSAWFSYWFWDRPKDFVYWLRDMRYYAKYRQHYAAKWDLEFYILRTLIHNIPSLIEYRSGMDMMMLERATRQLHKDEKDFDYAKYQEKMGYSWTKEEEVLAVKMTDEALETLLEAVKLYFYYLEGGRLYDCTKKDDPVDEEFDKKYHNTLPIIPGTYDSMDYDRLQKLTRKQWNRIWDLMKEYGHLLYD